jgi:hypothetical protein
MFCCADLLRSKLLDGENADVSMWDAVGRGGDVILGMEGSLLFWGSATCSFANCAFAQTAKFDAGKFAKLQCGVEISPDMVGELRGGKSDSTLS